ncbi:hypothetical protein K461DRAFT_16833 [Myriangium duriaei CBS 260.36]|uniref:Uncharacterized protein n=1 Tax=Myriangium duriaei CBS 260.36 TaxID=1168546 RepID=A0A9P4J9M3_9PEZI|nr:hypothetical protein K461DRAFT_16833 [Myriangium duriaei CBS 260.36]
MGTCTMQRIWVLVISGRGRRRQKGSNAKLISCNRGCWRDHGKSQMACQPPPAGPHDPRAAVSLPVYRRRLVEEEKEQQLRRVLRATAILSKKPWQHECRHPPSLRCKLFEKRVVQRARVSAESETRRATSRAAASKFLMNGGVGGAEIKEAQVTSMNATLVRRDRG